MVGLGNHAQENILPTIAVTDGVTVTAVCSRTASVVRQASHRWGAEFATTKIEDLFAWGDFEAVVAAAPPLVHEDLLRRALPRGIHVFVEKPPAVNLNALNELVSLASASTACTFVDYNFRYSTGFTTLVTALGGVTALRVCKIRFVTRKPRAPLWGLPTIFQSYLLGVAIHPIETMCNLFGAPDRVDARYAEVAGRCFSLLVTLSFPDGQIGVLDLGNYSNRFDYECELVTAAGRAGVLTDFHRLRVWDAVAPSAARSVVDSKEFVSCELPPSGVAFDRLGYLSCVAEFRDVVLSSASSTSPLEDSVPVYTVIEEISRMTNASS